jgi:hypothetical protein
VLSFLAQAVYGWFGTALFRVWLTPFTLECPHFTHFSLGRVLGIFAPVRRRPAVLFRQAVEPAESPKRTSSKYFARVELPLGFK